MYKGTKKKLYILIILPEYQHKTPHSRKFSQRTRHNFPKLEIPNLNVVSLQL